MKIKVKPQDFIVKEICTDLPLKKKGTYAVYLLTKKGENTTSAIRKLSKELDIALINFSYGGKKDKYAVTSQHIAIKGANQALGVERETYSLLFLGFMDRPMGPDLIEANRFEITLRDLTDTDLNTVRKSLEDINVFGYINYFDDQRFGSFDSKQGFIAEKIIKGHFNGALKIYLTHISYADRKETKERKTFFFENWGNWQNCLQKAETVFEKSVFSHLVEKPKGFIAILQKISREEMSLFFSAYQSFLWNELARRVLRLKIKTGLNFYKGIAADYIFYTTFNDTDAQYLKNLNIATASSKTKMPDDFTQAIYNDILNDNNLKSSLFNIRKIRQAFFKATERKFIVMAQELSFCIYSDDVYTGKKKITLKFILPRASYATMLIKRLFSKSFT